MKKITILLFAVAALGSGCKKFTNINQNPNQPLAVTPNVLLSAALNASGAGVAGNFFNTPRWMGYWARSGNYITTPPVEYYTIDVGYADGDWVSLYTQLNNYNNVENAGRANPSVLSFYIGVAQTMKALHFSTLVDAFNDVPYSQAFNLNKYSTPKYDDAATIYASLIAQCDSAVTFFTNAAAYYDAGGATAKTDNQYDIMFGRGGSLSADARMKLWIELANTVKLKLLLTEQNAPGITTSFINTELAKTTANGAGYLMAGQIASVNPNYTNSNSAQLSPFYGDFYTPAGATNGNYNFNRINQYSLNFFSNSGDNVRPNLVYTAASGEPLKGNYDGDPNSATDAVVGGLGPGNLKGPTQDQVIMTDFESLFMQAEAAARGWNVGGTAADLYKQAVEQDFVFLGDNVADADAYLTAGTGNYLVDMNAVHSIDGTPTTLNANGLETIMTQKWQALNSVNWEQAYTDFRRTGFPYQDPSNTGNFGVTHAGQPVTHNGKVEIPFRYLYPQSEISTNDANIPPGKTAYTPVFWDNREK